MANENVEQDVTAEDLEGVIGLYDAGIEESDEGAEPGDIESAEETVDDETQTGEKPGDDKGPETEDEGPSDPVPVEITSKIYRGFTREFGEDQAVELQRHWGDHALANYEIAEALIEDVPSLNETLTSYQTDDGSLSAVGIQAALQTLLEKSNYETPEALSKAHPELDQLFLDHFNPDTATLSPVGVYRVLHYIAHKSGYSHTYRSGRRSQPSNQDTQQSTQQRTTTMTEMSREDFKKGARAFHERIERAQSEGDSRTANEIYADLLKWIGEVQGDEPIVGSRGRTA